MLRTAFTSTALVALTVSSLLGQAHPPAPISADSLRQHLFTLSHDSMGGRASGSPGNAKTAEYVAAAFARYGLEPAGDSATFFQTVPIGRFSLDSSSWLDVDGIRLGLGVDFLPVGLSATSWTVANAPVIFGGYVNDQASWPSGEDTPGKVVVMLSSREPARGLMIPRTLLRDERLSRAAAVALVQLEALPPPFIARLLEGNVTVGAPTDAPLGRPLAIVVSTDVAERMLGSRIAAVTPGFRGRSVSGRLRAVFRPLGEPTRNVVAIWRGRDLTVNGQYISITAHNDHTGLRSQAVDHDSLRAFNRVIRPMGADSPEREPTPEERIRIQGILDSLRSIREPRADSVSNGADDDGSGTVALLEIARALSTRGERPRRSILFVSHVAEEMGLVGSRWFTDHPTVPRDSLVAELDLDMVGRGTAQDLPAGGPGYLELVGSRRLSTEFGDLLETVNARQPEPFRFNYEYDAPGHPLQYYCRADHFSYARYGIPSVSISRGEHLDYHQVTDEPQYIDYAALARVARLAMLTALAVADLDHRIVVDHAKPDPNEACRQ